MDSVKSIGFGFENCEYFNIDAKYFGTLELTDFRIDIQRVACNAILKMNCVDTVIMEIFSEGDNKYSSYGEDMTKFKRLNMYNDITSITVAYDNNSEEEYYVNYKDEVEGQLGSPNVYQTTYMSKLGNIYIVISKDKGVFDCFNEEEINDKESIEFSKLMILD